MCDPAHIRHTMSEILKLHLTEVVGEKKCYHSKILVYDGRHRNKGPLCISCCKYSYKVIHCTCTHVKDTHTIICQCFKQKQVNITKS